MFIKYDYNLWCIYLNYYQILVSLILAQLKSDFLCELQNVFKSLNISYMTIILWLENILFYYYNYPGKPGLE